MNKSAYAHCMLSGLQELLEHLETSSCKHGLPIKADCYVCGLEAEVVRLREAVYTTYPAMITDRDVALRESHNEIRRLREERFEYEKLAAHYQFLLSEALRELEWYADSVNGSKGSLKGTNLYLL